MQSLSQITWQACLELQDPEEAGQTSWRVWVVGLSTSWNAQGLAHTAKRHGMLHSGGTPHLNICAFPVMNTSASLRLARTREALKASLHTQMFQVQVWIRVVLYE